MENENITKTRNVAEDIQSNISKVIIGKDNVIKLVLTALLSDGHVLLDDVPGTGKTLLAKSLAKSIESDFKRIQFTPDLLPSDITGINVYNQKEGEFKFRKGPIFGNIILADEINRATPRTQSSLLECMEERQVTIDGDTRTLQSPFFVIATQNPVETAGTFQLPEAQLDRFVMKIKIGYPDMIEERAIIDRFLLDNPYEELKPVCTKEDILIMQKEIKQVYIHSSLRDYIVNIVETVRKSNNVIMAVSSRGTLDMVNAARAYAYINKRNYVVPEDIAELTVPVFAHRIALRMGISRDSDRTKFIQSIVDNVEVPTENWKV